MKYIMSKVSGIKFLLAAGLTAGLFLTAGQAMAMAYVQGTKAASADEVSGQSATEQQIQGYPMMGTFGASGNSQANYRPMTVATQASYSYNAASSSMALMAVITTVLIWIVLIQLIFLLAKLLKKHNKE